MTDPVTSYRNTCRNADLLLGRSPSQQCATAALTMLQTTNADLRQHRMDAPTARAALSAGRLAYCAGDLPEDLRPRLAAQLSELESRIDGLEQASGRRDDHIAPPGTQRIVRHGDVQAVSPRQVLNAGLSPTFAQLDRDMLPSEIQHSLFTDRAQTTRTLGALAAMSPSVLRELVSARVGEFHTDAVLAAVGDNARMQMRFRISERAQTSLLRGAERLERRSTGDGLRDTVGQLCGAQREPLLATLAALGADTDELRGFIARQSEPEALRELTTTVARTMSGGATQLRELAQRYDGAHNVLDSEGEFYQLFPESVRQVGAQLGMPVEASRSALGTFMREDLENAESAKRINEWIAGVAFVLSTIATGGLGGGALVGLSAATVRETARVGVAYEHAGAMTTAVAAGETDAESARTARTEAHVALGAAVAASALGLVAGNAAHGLTSETEEAAREVVEGVTAATTEVVTHPIIDALGSAALRPSDSH